MRTHLDGDAELEWVTTPERDEHNTATGRVKWALVVCKPNPCCCAEGCVNHEIRIKLASGVAEQGESGNAFALVRQYLDWMQGVEGIQRRTKR